MGQGYATEGARALIRSAFADLGVEQVVATTMTVNAGDLVYAATSASWRG
ncbi:MAG TPA: GNAT family N-acetyltransferase [Streptosporangiaceae bacterium]|nr:GNAT family N-acetyltransferase [Streptosporangiaceae bacterium]